MNKRAAAADINTVAMEDPYLACVMTGRALQCACLDVLLAKCSEIRRDFSRLEGAA